MVSKSILTLDHL